jgi:alpha-glucosidase
MQKFAIKNYKRQNLFVSMALTSFFLLGAQFANAEIIGQVKSPDKSLDVKIDLDGEGRIRYIVDKDGKEMISPSTMAFLMTDTGRLERGLKLDSTSTDTKNYIWELPWGETKYVKDNHNEITLNFTETDGAKRKVSVIFRVFDDGVGFRYYFPENREYKIQDELTEFNIAPEANALWIPAGELNRYEYLYQNTPLKEVTQAHTPMTVSTRDGYYMSFHEAALVDYSSMWLRRYTGQNFRTTLSPSPDGIRVKREGAFYTPWRSIIISKNLGGLVESHLSLNLNEPNKLGDVSWVKPQKYVGVWWEMHLDKTSWNSGPKHGANTENVKRYIDFAAKYGFRGVLVEGWNVGWDGKWFANGREFDFKKPYPDFDMDYLSKYAEKKGVHIIGHHETGANICNYEKQLGAALDYAKANNIEAIKTGYVADAGEVISCDTGDEIRIWHDGQRMVEHHLKVVEEAAKRHIAINPHEPIKDTGLRRTYPNWVAREGARGQEYNAWGVPPNQPNHEINLVFTRLLSGPMDYTPGIFKMEGKNGQKIETTLAKQLAFYIVIYSPIQMAADLPENYEANLKAFQFIRDLKVDWQDTKFMDGKIGEYVAIARKDRASNDWFIGAINNENPRDIALSLDFLDDGKKYIAEIYRDGPNADWRTNPYDIIIEKKVVKRGDILNYRLGVSGGAAIRIKAQ